MALVQDFASLGHSALSAFKPEIKEPSAKISWRQPVDLLNRAHTWAL